MVHLLFLVGCFKKSLLQLQVKILGNYSAIVCCNNNLPIPTGLSAPAASPTNCLGVSEYSYTLCIHIL